MINYKDKGYQMIKEIDSDPHGCGCAFVMAVFFTFLTFMLFVVIYGEKLIDLVKDYIAR